MRSSIFGVTAILLAGGLLTPAPRATSFEQAASPQQWRGTVAQGSAIEVKGVNGGITATAASGGEVEVSAVMKGRRSNPADVRIDVVQHGDGVTICAVYPSPDSRPNECKPGEGGRMNTRDNDVTVTFTVHVPAGVRFLGRTVNGDVTATDLGGAVSIHTVNGDVGFSTSAYGEASTVNGSIRGAMGAADWSEGLKFNTVNGSISLDLPSSASADVRASTVNGDITTDFPITVRGRFNQRTLSGTIGGGGRSLELETVNGSIKLRQR
jgi:hypothetical protein